MRGLSGSGLLTVVPLALSFGLAALLSYLLTIPTRALALRFGFVDIPDERRIHEGLRPRFGASMLLAFAIAALLVRRSLDSMVLGPLLAAAILVCIGALDDRRKFLPELSAAAQLGAQVAAGLIVVAFGILIRDVRDPTAGGPFGGLISLPLAIAAPLTVVWIAGMINTVNFLDGVDGLAAGVVAIASVFLALVSLKLGQADLAALCLALAGVCAGFLPHNFYPARIFMGTTGAWFLGLMLATLAIAGGAKLTTALLVIGVPIFDVAILILLRALAGQPIWRGDRRHLHHRLLDTGLSPRGTVLLYYVLSAVFGLYALLTTNNQSVGLGLKIYGLVMLVVVMLGTLTYLQRRRPA